MQPDPFNMNPIQPAQEQKAQTPAAPQQDTAFKGMEFIDLSLGKAPKKDTETVKKVYINTASAQQNAAH